jgi:hypothetical protein
MPYPDNFSWKAFDAHYGTEEDDAIVEHEYDDLLREIMADPESFVIEYFFNSDQYFGDETDEDIVHYSKMAREWARARLKGDVRHIPALEMAFEPSFEKNLEYNIEEYYKCR